MKLPRLIQGIAVLALVAAAGVAASSLRQGPVQPDQMHAWLQSHVGTWDAKVSGMMGESKGTWTVEAGPGGLWIAGEFKGEIMGGPFHGMEFMGYDPESKSFTSYWIDSMSPRATVTSGTYDKASKTMTLKGETTGPDGSPMTMTNVSRYTDADHMTFEMMGPGPDGKDMTMMTIEYARRK
jgi:hypothetical protein